ncbi:MAG: O-antigen ligase family protein, partial [Alphaproteobacteria bacterium]
LLAALLLYGFGTSNPNPIRWAALSAFAALAFVSWVWRGAPFTKDKVSWAAIGFVVFAGLSLLWSADPREGLAQIICWFGLLVLFLTIRHAERPALSLFVPLVAVAAYWLQVYIASTRGIHGGLGNENFQAEFLVLLAPLAFLWAWQFPNYPFGAICIATAICALGQAIFFNGSHAELAGLAGAGAAGFLLAGKRYWLAGGLAGGLALYGIAQSAQILTSVLSRFEMAYNATFMWLDRPFLGVGLGAFNYEYPRYGELHLEWALTEECLKVNTCTSAHGVQHFVGAAHNEYVQGIATFGLAGAVLIALALYLIARSSPRRGPLEWTGLAVVTILAGLSLVGFPLQNPPTAILGVTGLALWAGQYRGRLYPGRHKWACAVLILPLIGALGLFHLKAYSGAVHFTQAQRWAKLGNALQSFGAANEAFKAFPLKAQYRMQMVLSLESARANDKRVRVKPGVADKANRISRSAAPYHHGVLYARGAYLINTGRWRSERQEMDQLVRDLERYGSTHPESWMVIAAYRGNSGDKAGAVLAIDKALSHGGRFKDVAATAKGFGLRIERNGANKG